MKKLSPPLQVFCLICMLLLAYGGYNTALLAEEQQSPAGFLPTWRLLNNQEKQLFISGYLHGWRDAGRVTEAVEEHISKNPEQALSSLQTVRSLYDLGGKSVGPLVKGIDEFYSEPDNAPATLSQAITAASKRFE